MAFETIPLPPKSAVGALDPEIFGEGQRVDDGGQAVLLSNGQFADWQPPSIKPAIPDYSQIKAIAKYFNRQGPPQIFPAWLYHPTEPARVVRNAEEAAKLGVQYRKATGDERARYGVATLWDHEEGSLWRATPYDGPRRVDPNNPGVGKEFVHARQAPEVEQSRMISAVVAAVMAQMGKAQPASAGTTSVDPAEWEEFQRFKAWQAAQQIVATAAQDAMDHPPAALQAEPEEDEEIEDTSMPLSPEQEWETWRIEAERWDVRVDKRWSLDTLKYRAREAKRTFDKATKPG